MVLHCQKRPTIIGRESRKLFTEIGYGTVLEFVEISNRGIEQEAEDRSHD